MPTAANVEYHAKIVKEKALLRRLIEVSTDIITEAFEGRTTADELLDDAEQKIFQVSQQRGLRGLHAHQGAAVADDGAHRGACSAAARRSPASRAASPISTSSRPASSPSDLVIVAARPSMGKTAFVLNIAQYAAIENNVPVAIFSLEMSKESLVQRMLTAEGRVDAQKLRKGHAARRGLFRASRARRAS